MSLLRFKKKLFLKIHIRADNHLFSTLRCTHFKSENQALHGFIQTSTGSTILCSISRKDYIAKGGL